MTRTRVLRMLISLAAVLLTSLGVVAAGSVGASAETGISAREISEISPARYERKVKRWINRERVAHGLPKVHFSRCSDRIAERWSRHLAVNALFEHQDLSPFFRRCHATYAGETLVKGHVTPRQAVDAWMKSDGHRGILLSRIPRRVGIGAHLDRTGAWVVAADFIRL